ncbi:restriction endonuclease subunit S [Xanthobacter autotrophicus]|uniref:restriction endonuclease subunit S n=1 Tax=Xanthobacter autotrophicus TaxID=280 RepID=UPI00372AA0DD
MTDWRDITLDQLGRVVTGKTPPTADIENYGGTIPFVTPSDMDGRRSISDTSRCLTERGLRTVANAKIPSGSVMVSCIGSDMGKAAIARSDCITNQQINSIVVNADFDPLFVYYNLSVRKEEIRSAASGSAQPIMNKSTFGRIRISVPDKTKQTAIASILGALDDKIELNRQMNETLEAMARAIFKDWFVDFGPTRAKIEGRAPYLAPDIWSLFPDRLDEEGRPEGWQHCRLLDLCELKRGYDLPIAHRGVGSVPIISSSGLSGTHNRSMAKAPGVATGRYGTIGEVFFIEEDFWPLNTALYVCDFKGSAPRFIFYILGSIDFMIYSDKGAVPGINRNHLHEHVVIRPSPEVEMQFASILEPFWQRQRLNKLENASLAATRDLLLPMLMSGKIRVKDAEKLIEEVA